MIHQFRNNSYPEINSEIGDCNTHSNVFDTILEVFDQPMGSRRMYLPLSYCVEDRNSGVKTQSGEVEEELSVLASTVQQDRF